MEGKWDSFCNLYLENKIVLFVSFAATLEGSESDVRFVYCACSICYILQDWSAINIETATNYIINSIVKARLRNLLK